MARRLRVLVTHDTADYELLKRANEKWKFAIPLGQTLPPHLQAAFERGIDKQWFTLVDVSVVAEMPGTMLRIFRLTEAGAERYGELHDQFEVEYECSF